MLSGDQARSEALYYLRRVEERLEKAEDQNKRLLQENSDLQNQLNDALSSSCSRCDSWFHFPSLCPSCAATPVEDPKTFEEWLTKFRHEFHLEQVTLVVSCNGSSEEGDIEVVVGHYLKPFRRYETRNLLVWEAYDQTEYSFARSIDRAMAGVYAELVESAARIEEEQDDIKTALGIARVLLDELHGLTLEDARHSLAVLTDILHGDRLRCNGPFNWGAALARLEQLSKEAGCAAELVAETVDAMEGRR